MRLIRLFIPCLALLASCTANNDKESAKAILDTVSLSTKRYAIAYQNGDKIVASSADTINQVSFGGATNPAISPDGNKLAYTVKDSAGHTTIWVADMENKSQGQLKVNYDNYDQAVWAADGNSIAFSVLNKKGNWKVGIIKTDNTGFMMLDSTSKLSVYSPTWKDVNELVAHDLVNLYTFDVSGKLINTKLIANLIGKEFTLAKSNRFFYTKDGKKLIFSAGKMDAKKSKFPIEGVYLLDLATQKINQISPPEMNAFSLFVTADERIFFSGGDTPSTSKIYVSDFNGSAKVVVDKGTNPTGALK
ncbi:hypothetical protein [Pedobacter nototheniae]|uniref:TolB family protein n=1 Tax=Pedobacter nototheniae TaxID=2488994 RepID=UPI002930C6F0|nr:hypothetical protein [Pedobacter nototheniae]